METQEARTVIKDIVFRRIGVDIPLTEKQEAFSGRIPARALAVSNRFGITFFVHSEGFVATKTSQLVDVAAQAKEDASGKSALQNCFLDVKLKDVHILALSKDELTLAVCAGDQTVYFYDVPSLVHKKDSTPLESRNILEGHVKDLSWCPAEDEGYILVSKEGQLFTGQVGEDLKSVVDTAVVAASWSPDGKNIAYMTKDRSLNVTTNKFEPQYSFELPAKILDDNENPDLHVESIQWVRPDGILVAYIQKNEDDEEEECPFILLTKNGDFAMEGGTMTALVYNNIFPSIDSSVIPTGSGPYMLAEYLKPWDLVVAANRRSVDDHIVILGWFSDEDKSEALNIELSNDSWTPRIELQENGDDNVLLGLAIDRTTVDLMLTDPRDDSGDTKLPACPVLMCLSLGGKLSLFSVARLEKGATVAQLVTPASALPQSNRAKKSSKVSVEMASKPSPLVPVSKELPGTQQTRNRQAEERLDDEPSISSGSETDRENDQSDDDEVLSHFSGKGVKTTRSPDKSLPAQDSNNLKANSYSSLSQLQNLGASALSSLASTGVNNMSSLSSVKSAPSGLNHLQATTPTPQPPAILNKTVTHVQPSSTQFLAQSTSQSISYSSLPSFGDKSGQSGSMGFFGQTNKDAGDKSAQSASTGFFGQANKDAGDKSAQSASMGFSGRANRDAGDKPAQSANVAFFGQANKDAGDKPAQSANMGIFGQAIKDKGGRPFPTPSTGPFSQQQSLQADRFQTGPQKFNNSSARTPIVTPVRSSGASEPEQTFIIDLEKVKVMADEVDAMMAYIEGRTQKTAYPCFTKQALNELELGIRTLADNCRTVKEKVEEERQGINDLRAENLQVDAWRIYVQSLAEQAAENRYQDLWSRRKLAPDLDVKRKRVTKAEQALKQQIAALEEHVHHLELDSRKRHSSLKGAKNNLLRQASAGRSQSLQNLYSTVNGLLASADRLSQQVAQQMEALNITAQPATAQKIMKSVGLTPDNSPPVHVRPAPMGTVPSPHVRHQLTYSPSSKPESGTTNLATPPRRAMPTDSGVGAPSITRRRRDSMDGVQRALTGGASPKTTIERVAHQTPIQQLNPPNKPSTSFTKHLRQRSFQDSSEESTSQPRQVRRVLSNQTGSVTSSAPPPSNASTFENKASSDVSSLHGSHSSPSWHDQQSGDSRPDPKRAVPRSAVSFAEKSGPALASRFGPPPGRTVSTPAPAFSTSSTSAPSVNTSSASSNVTPGGGLPSNPPSEGLLKWANNRSATSASSFSFVLTPAAPKPAAPETSGLLPAGKPANTFGTTQASSAGMFPSTAPSSSSFSSSMFGASGSGHTTGNQKAGHESVPKFGVESNSKPALEMDKQEKSTVGFKASSFGTPFSSTPSFGSGFSSNLQSGQPAGGASSVASTPAFGSVFSSSLQSGQPMGGASSVASTPTFGSGLSSSLQSGKPTNGVASVASTPSFGSGLSSNLQSGQPTSGAASGASTPSLSSFSMSFSGNKSLGLKEGSSEVKPNESKLVLPLTPPAPQPFVNQSTLNKPTTNTAVSSSTPVNITQPTLPSSPPAPAQKAPSPFTQIATAPAASPTVTPPSQQPSANHTPSETNKAQPSPSPMGGMNFAPTIPLPGVSSSSASSSPFVFPAANTPAQPFSVPPILTADADEEDMDEEQVVTGGAAPSLGGFNLGGLGLGSTAASSAAPKTNIFGNSSPFGTQQTSSSFTLTSPQGQLFRPAAFNLPSAQSPPQASGGFGGLANSMPQQSGATPFGSGFGGGAASNPSSGSPFGTNAGGSNPAFGGGSSPAFGTPALPGAGGGFGQRAQLGPGQQALGSALGTFGQTRQMGAGLASPFGSTPSGGFGNAPSGGGFASAGTGGGFASAATGGGFASAATGGGFAGAAGASGGFAGASGGGGFGQGFGANQSGGGGFGQFSGSGASGFGNSTSPPAQTNNLFTQMRK